MTEICIYTCRALHSPALLRLTSRKPLWLDLQPVEIRSRWRHSWKSSQVVNSHLVCDPSIRQPGFDLPRQQWSLLNRFRTEQGHCDACRRQWRLTDTDLSVSLWRDATQNVVESYPLTKLNGGLSRLHSADEDPVSWLTSYGSWHAYEKKCILYYKSCTSSCCYNCINKKLIISDWSFRPTFQRLNFRT